MALELTTLSQLLDHGFDDIIDVRSPAEWAEDRLPGAINLPVLDDLERARVGTIYVQESHFLARRIGAALVARNAARHLETALSDKPANYRPLVYCWRGGQRSGAFGLILAQVGWRVQVLTGGYRSYRRLVTGAVRDTRFGVPMILLDGDTGTAKTAVLAHLLAQGQQVIDLEGLANHRGSLFGARAGGQPAQKAFESRLAMQIAALDPARPVFLEAESSRIGDLLVPPAVWAAMRVAPRIEITAPLSTRADYLARAYADIVAEPGALAARISQLQPMHSRERIAEWQSLAAAGALAPLASGLMRDHYDPRYARSRERGLQPDACIAAAGLADDDLAGLARQVVAAAQAIMSRARPVQPDP